MSVMMTSTSMTEDSEEATLIIAKELERVTCIQYPIAFPDGVTQDSSALGPMSALLDLGSKVNAIHPAFAERVRFFEETFLVANVSLDVIFGMPFLTLSGADVDFPKKEL